MTDEQPAETFRSRVDASGLTMWVLLDGDRMAVTGVTLVVVFVSLLGLAVVDPVGLLAAISASDPTETLFQALTTGIITGVTLVVSINSLVLSQELGAVGDQRERMEGAMSFRREAERELDLSTAPSDPASFLRVALETARERADSIRDHAEDCPDQDVREQLVEYVETLLADAETAQNRLAGAEFGSFRVVRAALDFDYSNNIHRGRALRNDHRDALSAATLTALRDIVDALTLFGAAREHVKTLYFQWELINLSRAITYAAVPALIVTIGGILTLDNLGTVPGATLGLPNVTWLTVAAATVGVTPFVVLLVYVLRIATVAKRTLAIGPFVLREK